MKQTLPTVVITAGSYFIVGLFLLSGGNLLRDQRAALRVGVASRP